jgi:hypothetical protein
MKMQSGYREKRESKKHENQISETVFKRRAAHAIHLDFLVAFGADMALVSGTKDNGDKNRSATAHYGPDD